MDIATMDKFRKVVKQIKLLLKAFGIGAKKKKL